MLIHWVPAVATLIAALMIAANLGARFTGWGFAAYCLASAIWILSQVSQPDPDMAVVVMHSVLLLFNLFGTWRWLGPRKHYEDSRQRASERSRRAPVPTLFSTDALIGATVQGTGETTRGTVVDAMLKCEEKELAYLVISEGGVGGAGETLRAVPPEHLRFDQDKVASDLSDDEWRRLPPIENDHWPATAPEPVR